jgi:hypothetical protein
MKNDLSIELKEYNRTLKSVGLKTISMEEYVEIKKGRKNKTLKSAIKSPLHSTHYQRQNDEIPSLCTNTHEKNITARKEEKIYTGTNLIGISIIHKSCLQPIFSKQAAQDAANMRR